MPLFLDAYFHFLPSFLCYRSTTTSLCYTKSCPVSSTQCDKTKYVTTFVQFSLLNLRSPNRITIVHIATWKNIRPGTYRMTVKFQQHWNNTSNSTDDFDDFHLQLRTTAAQWLRCCATNRKHAGSIPAGFSGFFIDIKSFRSHHGPGVDSASNRNQYQEYFLGGKGGRCVRLTTYHHPVPLSRNLGTLTSWNPLGPPGPVTGLIYLYLLPSAARISTDVPRLDSPSQIKSP